MSATLSKLRISWVGRALLAYAVSALALVVLGLAAPGSAVFFPLVSLWCNLALFGLVLVVLRLADYPDGRYKIYRGDTFYGIAEVKNGRARIKTKLC